MNNENLDIPEYGDFEHLGYKVAMEIDGDGYFDNPRSWDNVWTILTDQPRKIPIDDQLDMDGDERVRDAFMVANVYCFEHGNVSYRAGDANPFSCPWDSGQVGFAIVSEEKLAECWPSVEDPQELYDKAKACLDSELATYTSWANGEIYCVTATDPDGEVIDSCSGIYEDEKGTGWAIREYGLPAIESDIFDREKEASEKLRWEERDVETVS